MSHEHSEEPTRVRRVFGFAVFLAAVGLTCSWLMPRSPSGGLPAAASVDARADAALAYAACQAGVRDKGMRGAALRFPDVAESFGSVAGGHQAVVSRVVVEPPSGAPFVQRFVCRVERTGPARASVWRVSRLSLDLPVT